MPEPLHRALIVIVFGCLPGAPPQGTTRDAVCHINGFETPVTCAALRVPRDYAEPDGDTLELTAVVIPASTGRPAADPLLVLAGGPGQSASSLAAWLEPMLTQVRRERDVVLFDVRGTGLSEPLHCDLPVSMIAVEDTGAAGEASSPGAFDEFRRAVAACAHELGPRARHHTSREAVEDIERFRSARGYTALNLWGGSYGTRIAQHYVRAYGERVRAVVLDAVSPVSTSLLVTGAHTPDAALAQLFGDCAASPACAAAFPNLPADFERLLRAAASEAILAPGVDPVTGRRGTLALDYFALANTVRVALYGRATTEILPLTIDAATRGDFAPLLGIAGAMAGDPAAIAFGAQLSMLCAEDWPVAREAGATARTGGFMRDGYYAFFAHACEVWPTAPLPRAMREPLRSSVPALAISGDRDPVTPPALAEQTLMQFAESVHLVLRPGFHTNSGNPCVARIVASFLADPSTGGRDHDCLAAPPLRLATRPSN